MARLCSMNHPWVWHHSKQIRGTEGLHLIPNAFSGIHRAQLKLWKECAAKSDELTWWTRRKHKTQDGRYVLWKLNNSESQTPKLIKELGMWPASGNSSGTNEAWCSLASTNGQTSSSSKCGGLFNKRHIMLISARSSADNLVLFELSAILSVNCSECACVYVWVSVCVKVYVWKRWSWVNQIV